MQDTTPLSEQEDEKIKAAQCLMYELAKGQRSGEENGFLNFDDVERYFKDKDFRQQKTFTGI